MKHGQQTTQAQCSSRHLEDEAVSPAAYVYPFDSDLSTALFTLNICKEQKTGYFYVLVSICFCYFVTSSNLNVTVRMKWNLHFISFGHLGWQLVWPELHLGWPWPPLATPVEPPLFQTKSLNLVNLFSIMNCYWTWVYEYFLNEAGRNLLE